MNFTEGLFNIANALILPCWLLLIVFPRSSITAKIFDHPKFSPMQLIAVLYAVMVVPALIQAPEVLLSLSRPTLDGIQKLLSSPEGAAAGWIHYLCFDLFVGVSVWKKAIQRKHGFVWVGPVLFVVLMFGPVGWLMHECGSILIAGRQTKS